MRHGEAKPGDGGGDKARGLTENGISVSQAMKQALENRGMHFQSIFCSTAARTQETTQELGLLEQSTLLDNLYLAPLSYLLELVGARTVEEQSILIVGHNPGLSELSDELGDGPILAPGKGLLFRGQGATWEAALQNDWSWEWIQ